MSPPTGLPCATCLGSASSCGRANDEEAEGTAAPVLQDPSVHAPPVEVVAALEDPELLTGGVATEADAAGLGVAVGHRVVTRKAQLQQGLTPGGRLAALLQRFRPRPVPCLVPAHEEVEHGHAEHAVHDNADEAHEAVPPEPQSERGQLDGREAEHDRDGTKPHVVRQQQTPLLCKGVSIDVHEALRHELRRGLLPSLREQVPGLDPVVRPWSD
mmetsp:Transcript_71454/g.213179  ORF Transcript_71454/g.213179 Transcript_71454/m.213179 type:complete len:214 (-) Transcript_71454:413-1054(-)